MSRLGGTPDEARSDFARLRELRDRLLAVCPPEISLQELSMGMSGDFEAAVEEGATLVRIGSALFEGVETP
jgi:PLP dependent protein